MISLSLATIISFGLLSIVKVAVRTSFWLAATTSLRLQDVIKVINNAAEVGLNYIKTSLPYH